MRAVDGRRHALLIVPLFASVAFATLWAGGQPKAATERKVCQSPDGVSIVYSARGTGTTALVFIHGGMADRSFFDGQLEAFASRYRVIALDLAGHGESGRNRAEWRMQRFGADVKAVIEAEKLTRVILFGNSLGGPVAVETALMLPRTIIGVVGIDTFQDLGRPDTPEAEREMDEALRQRAEGLRSDFRGTMTKMVRMLFHADVDPKLVAAVEARMLRTPPEVVHAMLAGIADYDTRVSARRLTVPLRAINGDVFPTNVAAIRQVNPGFDAVIMTHVGHYPMLERPGEFNEHIARTAAALEKASPPRGATASLSEPRPDRRVE